MQRMIIGFTHKTSKLLPRLICRRFRHCAPIVPCGNGYILYQFTRRGHVTPIVLRRRDLNLLRAHGWRFLRVWGRMRPMDAARVRTCVGLCKYAVGCRAQCIRTPDALYRHLIKKYNAAIASAK